jgi:hypothetical protein
VTKRAWAPAVVDSGSVGFFPYLSASVQENKRKEKKKKMLFQIEKKMLFRARCKSADILRIMRAALIVCVWGGGGGGGSF